MRKKTDGLVLPVPSCETVEAYLRKWSGLLNYTRQEDALNKLFFQLAPENEDLSDILLKVAALNDFYSTNIFSVFTVAEHIQSLHIDKRLIAGDESLVNDLQNVTINGKEKHFYSFATKYCSHHRPLDFPIYDSYVDAVLRYYRDKDHFCDFGRNDLKDYACFKKTMMAFQSFYGLEKFNLKEIDKFLWQLGKEYFPKKYY